MGWSESLTRRSQQEPGRFWPAIALLAILLLVLGLAALLGWGEREPSAPGHTERAPIAEGNPSWLC